MAAGWSPDHYATHTAFVPALGAAIFDRLAPRRGERILDVGCGDGTLTARLIEAGADVVAIDASPEMVAAATVRGVPARTMDARALTFDAEFDAVFSNAALHWVPEADAVLRGIARALKPGGRFVAELGGHGNVAAIAVAIRAVFARHRIGLQLPWYFPSADEYAALAAAHGLTVRSIALFPRPTPLPTGMAGWLQTFGVPIWGGLTPDLRQRVEAEIVDLLAPSLRDVAGRWTADYVRLQIDAVKPAA